LMSHRSHRRHASVTRTWLSLFGFAMQYLSTSQVSWRITASVWWQVWANPASDVKNLRVLCREAFIRMFVSSFAR
jgi:hypothetical protein